MNKHNKEVKVPPQAVERGRQAEKTVNQKDKSHQEKELKHINKAKLPIQ